MRPRQRILATLSVCALLVGCSGDRLLDASTEAVRPPAASEASLVRSASSQIALPFVLPMLTGRIGEARAVNDAGTVIAGYSLERLGGTRAVKWTLQADGSWAITVLPHESSATGASASGVSAAGDVAGSEFVAPRGRVVLWSADGSFRALGCDDQGDAEGISSDGRVVVGTQRSVQPSTASLWRQAGCREDLPSLVPGGFSNAAAVNGDATVVGGGGSTTTSGGSFFPVRWRLVGGAWQIEQLDQRLGFAEGANAGGDVAGYVYVGCSRPDGCQRAVIWYADGSSRELGTLGGDISWVRDINSAGEAVGGSAPRAGDNTGYFWSQSSGMVPLPFKGRWAAPFAVSEVRADGTRLVVGSDSQKRPVAWVVQNP